MRYMYKESKIVKVLTKICLGIISFSLAFLLISSQGLAQVKYWDYYYPYQFLPSSFYFPSQYGAHQFSQPYPLNRFSLYNTTDNFYYDFSIPEYSLNNLADYHFFSSSGSAGLLTPFLTNMYSGSGTYSSFYHYPGYAYNFQSPLTFIDYLADHKPPNISEPVKELEYLAVLPRAFHIGGQESVSISLFEREGSARYKAIGNVGVILSKDGNPVLEAENSIDGKGTIEFIVPEIEAGEYELTIKGETFEDRAIISVIEDLMVFIQTDKPVYQPGQTVHMRVITLNSELKPKTKDVVMEVQDAKGIKIFRKELNTDKYGLATVDLPISREPNLGVWKITSVSEPVSSQMDIRVEEYVLPKYEVKAELPKEWFLVNEPIRGKIKAEYSFGKPVKGDLLIKASRYVGEWEEYETFSAEIDGEAEFEISPVMYVAGVPAADGKGNVTLDVIVKERNTGYEEKTNKLFTISDSSAVLQVIPECSVFKPLLPFHFLIVSKTPDHKPCEAQGSIEVNYIDNELNQTGIEEFLLETEGGKALLTLTPPEGCVAIVVNVYAQGVQVSKALQASYSPSGNFIHLEQITPGIPKVGEEIWFKVHSTNEAVHFYYEVISRDKVVFSDFTGSSEISLIATPMMAPQAKLLVYQILPNSEVAADFLPFDVEADYPLSVKAQFSSEEVSPGEELSIMIETEGKTKIGLAAVDKSVFILAENRLNLQQVFEELERLYMQPQAELHSTSVYSKVCTKGAQEIFQDAGVIVLSNKIIPPGKTYEKWPWIWGIPWGEWGAWDGGMFLFAADIDRQSHGVASGTPEAVYSYSGSGTEELAQVEKIRQFFPETWLWQDLVTDNQGHASVTVEAPDTITTWMLQAVALSKEKGLGICENELRAFQPFFIKIDLPYSAIRGEEFPVTVSVYNYLNEEQNVQVEIKEDNWFSLLDNAQTMIEVPANDIGGAQFKIKPTHVGVKEIEVTARSSDMADAVIKTIIIIPEGVERECVQNLVINAGDSKIFNTSIPMNAVNDSGRSYLAATASYLAQTIEGLDELLKMPFGCGEQNMMNLAPDIYIVHYLKETAQLKPETMAKAEKLMITGYQRELTYRRNDGSFSAFGERDQEGSLWLTAFVLKVFAQGRSIMYIDDTILNQAKSWIINHQNEDGSFDSVGFLHHKEMIGGMEGKTALSAFTAIALLTSGEITGSAKAIAYLESQLNEIKDAYTMALVAYALELAESPGRQEAYAKLMDFAQEGEDGLHWSAGGADIETTAYASLALLKHGDKLNAGRAAKWLVTQRNALGGFRSTQDTVMALEALTEYSKGARSAVDLTIEIKMGEGVHKEIHITEENFDVLQVVEVPINAEIELISRGTGEAVIQFVKRFNLPCPPETGQAFHITVDYDTAEVAVNDIVIVSVELCFNPILSIEAGMVVLDISVPTGFIPVSSTLDDLLETEEKIKRYEIAGRKVIFYIENMVPLESIDFTFDVKAMYPVKAKGATSQAYSYYNPEMKGETLSKELSISGQ